MFYLIVRAVLRVVLRIVFRMEVEGEENVPKEGPCILAGNHLSMLDPVVIACAVDRPVRFMAKHDLFNNRFFSAVLKGLGAFPVRRGRDDKDAFHKAQEILREGQALGMFPEGTRSLDGRLQPAHSGAAILAEKMGAPVVPVGIIGTGRIMRKGAILPRSGKIAVRFGQPIYSRSRHDGQGAEGILPSGAADLKEAMMQEIAKLVTSGA